MVGEASALNGAVLCRHAREAVIIGPVWGGPLVVRGAERQFWHSEIATLGLLVSLDRWLLEKREDVATLRLPADDHLPGSINAVHLKD
jgi:hypothetical protein